MTIHIPVWLVEIAKWTGIGAVAILAVLGVFFLLYMRGLRVWMR